MPARLWPQRWAGSASESCWLSARSGRRRKPIRPPGRNQRLVELPCRMRPSLQNRFPAGTAAIPLHPAQPPNCEFAGTLEEMTFRAIVQLHPLPGSDFREALLRCAEECLDCGASCTACADASLSESDLAELTRVIRVCLDCADVCEATARIAVRQTRPDIRLVRATIEACAAACAACAEECDRHAAHHEHCRVCADVCRRCKAACDEVLAF